LFDLLAQLFVVDNCIDDWRIAVSTHRVVQLTVELLVCIVHPVPGDFACVPSSVLPSIGPPLGAFQVNDWLDVERP
jgi:hypothetical protein